MRMRGFGFGRPRDGIIPVRGGLLPDVAAKFQAVFDACMSPRTGPAFMSAEELAARDLVDDPRSRDQQRHDILAGVIDMAARSGTLPTIGGAAPTVLVSVRQQDLEAGRGAGFIGEVPISMRAVKQFTCTGGMQKVVFDDNGRIIELGSPNRVSPRRTAGDQPARRGVLRAGLPRPGRLVGDPPCRPGRERWRHPYRQRFASVLVPPPHPGELRLGIPDDQGSAQGEISALAGPGRNLVPHQRIPHPPTRHPRTHPRLVQAHGGWHALEASPPTFLPSGIR